MNTFDAVDDMVGKAFRQFGGVGDPHARVIRQRITNSEQRTVMRTPLSGMSERKLKKMLHDAVPDDTLVRNDYVRLRLDMPPSANRYWRTGSGHVYVSDEALDYKNDVAITARQQGVRKPFTGDVAVTVYVYRKQRSGDLDNRLKVLLDALKGIAFEDDKQVVEIHAFRRDDKADPRVEVQIRKTNNE